jgi:hypothetical protein
MIMRLGMSARQLNVGRNMIADSSVTRSGLYLRGRGVVLMITYWLSDAQSRSSSANPDTVNAIPERLLND